MTSDSKQLESARGQTKLLAQIQTAITKYDPRLDIRTQWLNYAGVDSVQVQILLLGLINMVWNYTMYS